MITVWNYSDRKEYRGQSVESIARRLFGRDVSVTPDYSNRDPYREVYEIDRDGEFVSRFIVYSEDDPWRMPKALNLHAYVPSGVLTLPNGVRLYAESEINLMDGQDEAGMISFWTPAVDDDDEDWEVAFTFPMEYFKRTPASKLDWQGHISDWVCDGPRSDSPRLRSKPKGGRGGSPDNMDSSEYFDSIRNRTKNVHGKPGVSTQQTPSGFNRDMFESVTEDKKVGGQRNTGRNTGRNSCKKSDSSTKKGAPKNKKNGKNSKSSGNSKGARR